MAEYDEAVLCGTFFAVVSVAKPSVHAVHITCGII